MIYFSCKNCNPLKKVTSFPPFSFLYCLSRNTLFINLFCSDELKKKKQISSFNFNCWFILTFFFLLLDLILLFCIYVSWGAFLHFGYHEITFMNSFLFAYMHSFLFGVSWRNHVKNYRLLLFFQFPRKLSTRLILPP